MVHRFLVVGDQEPMEEGGGLIPKAGKSFKEVVMGGLGPTLMDNEMGEGEGGEGDATM